MEAIYLFGDVSAYLGRAQNPVRYVNCRGEGDDRDAAAQERTRR
jgi:hypothetical protein